MPFSNFPKIEEHGALFNNRSAALVSKHGEIDWACLPNFDSDPVFFSILDRDAGGRFTISPVDKAYVSTQKYVNDTNILQTEFFYEEKLALRILDFLPMLDQPQALLPEIHRRVECFKDDLNVEVEFFTFNQKDDLETVEFADNGYIIKSGNRTQAISTDVKLEKRARGVSGIFKMVSGDARWFVTANSVKESHHIKSFDSERRLNETELFWRSLLAKTKYPGMFSDWVNRSILVLKGLFFDPKYFMVAAPTSSLPEVIGEGANWDYRFMWIRDTAYVIDALASLGNTEEAMKFFYSLVGQIQADKGSIKSVYPISNPDALTEKEVDLYGYLGSKPVRFGNKASAQFQLDQYGSLINAIAAAQKHGAVITAEMMELVKMTAHKLIDDWQKPDRSIWESRTEDRQYVYSKVLAWEAMNNAVQLLTDIENPDEINRIRDTANEIKRTVQEKGIDRNGKFYVQYFGSDQVDAALLRMPLVGFCSPQEETFVNTLKQIEKKLMVSDFLFKRYEQEGGNDFHDNAFLLLSFWYIEDLAMMGMLNRANDGLSKLMSYFNNLQLLPEELDLNDKKYLGNYPQALSHVGLISAIIRLGQYQPKT